jgi:YD repeat-containing protein
MRKRIYNILTIVILSFNNSAANAQTQYPEPVVNQSYVPSGPEAQSMQDYGNNPTALYEGLPAISIPIYQVKCGSLSMPISLAYNYNGLYPLQDASWVGLGWNLIAGGVISRIIGGYADSSQNSGYNYGQYNITDTLFTTYNYNNFLQNAYNNNLSYAHKSYDLIPDIFDCETDVFSDKFFWYNSKAYQLNYDKQLSVSWPTQSGSINITSADGTVYTFGAKDTTTYNVYGGSIYAPVTYFSAWHLTMVVSADKKDTITLSYVPYKWIQYGANYQTSYTVSNGTQASLGADPTTFFVTPSVQSQVLQSIRCRNSRVSFLPDAVLRTDFAQTYPKLAEIDIIDSLTGTVVKKEKLSYEYFGQTGTNAAQYERLKLKRLNATNTLLSNDSLTYTFKYINEYGTFPSKSTFGIDYFGFYNGQDGNTSLQIPSTSSYYKPSPPSSQSFGTSNNRVPNITYDSYGALDTIVYPAGGYTVFQYGQNYYLDNTSTNQMGPGIRIQNITNYSGYSPVPTLQKTYGYVADNTALSSGAAGNPPYINGYTFLTYDGTNNYTYTQYNAPNNGPGAGGNDPLFYYQKVSESVVSGNETHKSDHYFNNFPGIYLNVRQTNQIDYVNAIGTNVFTPIAKMANTYGSVNDTSFTAAYPFISNENYNSAQHPPITYTYTYGFSYNTWTTVWTFPISQQSVQYDLKGDSIVNTVNFNFNTATRNLSSTQQGTSDGQTITQKFKYPEDYTSGLTGNMVSARVLSPVIEKQTWMKRDASDSALISGTITVFDQTIYKPITAYSIETTSPISALSNETKTGNLYNTILSDSRYIMKSQLQYDLNNNPSTSTKSADMNISYLWDYRHAQPIAEVSNAAQTDIAYTSFEADGFGNWVFTGSANLDNTSPTGNSCYNIGQTSGTITKSGLTSATSYLVSYWIKGTTSLSITGTVAGYPVKGKTINGWTYFEHKISGQTSCTVSGTGAVYIDELRLYPYAAQMKTFTYTPLIGKSSQCDADNRITYYQYDGFGRLKVLLDQDHNIVKTYQYHYNGETAE